jgi:hypothetical protein
MCILDTVYYTGLTVHINTLYKYIHEAAFTDRIIKEPPRIDSPVDYIVCYIDRLPAWKG